MEEKKLKDCTIFCPPPCADGDFGTHYTTGYRTIFCPPFTTGRPCEEGWLAGLHSSVWRMLMRIYGRSKRPWRTRWQLDFYNASNFTYSTFYFCLLSFCSSTSTSTSTNTTTSPAAAVGRRGGGFWWVLWRWHQHHCLWHTVVQTSIWHGFLLDTSSFGQIIASGFWWTDICSFPANWGETSLIWPSYKL